MKRKLCGLLVLSLSILAVGLAGADTVRNRRRRAPAQAVAMEGKGYVDADLPLYETPKRWWEGQTGPVRHPLVRRVSRAGLRQKDLQWVRREGFLSGKSVYLSPGHGWTWTGSVWTTQRGNSYGIVEDLSNAEAVNQFLVEYLVRAGAHVVPVREIDLTDVMVICDNEDGQDNPEVGIYEEQGDAALFSDSTLAGYTPRTYPLTGTENPFAAGTNRLLDTDSVETGRFVWTPNVPRTDHYNVYVSFSAYSERAPDAHYIVKHAAGEDHFRVNQRHMGSTWVFLGRFPFRQGTDPVHGAVVLTNDSAHAGPGVQVSADAVRLGGGMGLVDRGQGVSGHPRYEENCRYHAQFMGAPSSVYNSSASGDGTDDVSCRSRLAAWLHEPGEDAVYFSWHTNAGGGQGTSIYIYWPDSHGFCDGTQATAGSRELADSVLAEVVDDIRAVWDGDWTDRGRRCAWFGELNPSYNDEMPAALIELAFHDLPEDVDDIKEPAFRRLAARAIYQGIVKYFADRDGVTPALLPEPPRNVVARQTGPCTVELSWEPPAPDAVAGDAPQSYLVYMGEGNDPPGNPIDTAGATSLVLNDLTPGGLYTFRVAAVNEGGESLPTRLLAVSMSGWPPHVPVLVVQGFGRLDSSQLLLRYESSALGDVDRMVLRRMNDGSYLNRHGPEIAAFGASFDSCEDTAVAAGVVDLSEYAVVDFVVGWGATSAHAVRPEVIAALRTFVENGGQLIISGSRLAGELLSGDSAAQAFVNEICAVAGVGGQVAYEVSGRGVLDGQWSLEDGWSATPFYDAAPTDSLDPAGGAAEVAVFESRGLGVAGITSGATGLGRVVLLSFPLESIVEENERREVFAALLNHLAVEVQSSDRCEPPVDPDGGMADGGDGGSDAEVTQDASGLPACRDCPCESNGCSCRLERSRVRGSAMVAFMLLVLLGLWQLRRITRNPRTSS
jgi:N-acetylmuramoyl-L-alanine amidase